MSTLTAENHTHITKEEFDSLPKLAQDAITASKIPISITHTIKTASVKVEPKQVAGTPITLRYDWGPLLGGHILTLYWSTVTGRTAVFAAAGESAPGGPAAGKIIGPDQITIHNVAPSNGVLSIWVEVSGSTPVPVSVDYLVIGIDILE